MQVPNNDGIAETLHRLGIAHHLAKVHHVVVPAGEGGRHQHIASWQGASVVSIAVREVSRFLGTLQVVIRRHPDAGDEVAAVGVLRHAGTAAVVAVIGQTGDQHASGQRIVGMGPDHAAGLLDEVVNGAVQLGRCRVRVDIEDEDFAGVQTGRPQEAAIIGQARMVRFVAATHGDRVNDLRIGFRVGVNVYGDEFVLTVANALKAQRPDIHIVFLAHDLGHIRRHAGFVCRRRLYQYGQRNQCREKSFYYHHCLQCFLPQLGRCYHLQPSLRIVFRPR